MDMTRANSYGFQPQMSIKNGIIDTIQWYQTNKNLLLNSRYNAFTEKAHLPTQTQEIA